MEHYGVFRRGQVAQYAGCKLHVPSAHADVLPITRVGRFLRRFNPDEGECPEFGQSRTVTPTTIRVFDTALRYATVSVSGRRADEITESTKQDADVSFEAYGLSVLTVEARLNLVGHAVVPVYLRQPGNSWQYGSSDTHSSQFD